MKQTAATPTADQPFLHCLLANKKKQLLT